MPVDGGEGDLFRETLPLIALESADIDEPDEEEDEENEEEDEDEDEDHDEKASRKKRKAA